jgi:hypothetical protein
MATFRNTKQNEIEKNIPIKEGSKLKELCSVFISNSIYYSQGIDKGKSAIIKYLSDDSSSADLNYNYAMMLVSSGDTWGKLLVRTCVGIVCFLVGDHTQE